MDVARLRAIPLFAGLTEPELRRLANWADEVDVPEGRKLVEQGRFAHEFFVIEEGTAQVTQDGRPVAELGQGDFFGEIALLEADRRTASVTALTPMRLIVMFEREFRAMASEMPEVAERIREAIRRRRGVA